MRWSEEGPCPGGSRTSRPSHNPAPLAPPDPRAWGCRPGSGAKDAEDVRVRPLEPAASAVPAGP